MNIILAKGSYMPVYQLENIKPEIDISAFIAPNATIIGKTIIKKNASIWFNTVLRADCDQITIGEDTNIQDLTMCHADTGQPLTIGNRVTIGHNSILHGCTIEDDCLIGMGVIIMNGAVVRKGSLIAAGTLILENTEIPENSFVAGSPGKIKKEINKDVIAIMRASAKIYKNRSKIYKEPELFFLSK